MRPFHIYQLIFLPALLSFASCVSTGKFKDMQQQAQKNDSLYTWSMHTLKTCQDDNDNLNKQKSSLQSQLNSVNSLLTASNENNTQLRRQLQDLSAISSSQAESIKNSLDNMSAKDTYLRNLRSAVAHRDSVNLAVLMNLKMTIGGFASEGAAIKVADGVVSVDLSDSLLFSGDSNSYALTDKAKGILGRLAKVFNDQPDLEFMVDAHTDSIPSMPDSLMDNWELSAKRATAVVRILQNKYNIAPIRMTAAGSIAPDHQTRIIVTPQLGPLLRVLDPSQGQSAPAAPPAPSTSPAPVPPTTSVAPPASAPPTTSPATVPITSSPAPTH